MTALPPLAPALPRPAVARPQGAFGPAPAIRAKAQGRDPLPSFKAPEDYKNYVINLVAQAQGTERELETARKDLNQGKEGTKAVISTLQERLDAIKLQLKILRDDYPIPAEWTRSRLLFGQGFDKDAFWKAQVEAIPGQEVVIPQPAPAPPRPAPAPAAPAPAAPPRPAPTGTGDLPPALQKLLLTYAAEGATGNDNSAGNAFMRGKLQAMLPILAGKADPAVRDAETLVKDTLREYDGNYSTTHYAYRAAFAAVRQLIGGAGSVQQRHDRASGALAAEGVTANDNSAGNAFARQKLIAIQRHADLGEGPRAQEIAKLTARVRREYDGNYSTTHYAYKLTFRSVTALLSDRGSIDDRKKAVIGGMAADARQANDNSAGNSYARGHLMAILRLTEGSADPALQGIDALVRDCVRQHDGNYTRTHQAYQATLQAVQAMLA